jgi:nucleotide-binding universal stress UspA family protein
MRQTEFLTAPFVRSVFHATDFSEASEHAFAHALAIALFRETQFTILHAGMTDTDADWRGFPSVRDTLDRWGLLGEFRAALDDLTLRVRKIAMREQDPLAASLEFLDKRPTDLIVLATEGRTGLRPSVAEKIARKSNTMTLFVPGTGRGFVSPDDGALTLRRILIPIDHKPDPDLAIRNTARAAQMTGDDPVEVFLLHVSRKPGPGFDLAVPDEPSCIWCPRHSLGDPVDRIIETAEENRVDLIVMPTTGRNGILDALRGSVTERVLRRAPCPLLAVPAE